MGFDYYLRQQSERERTSIPATDADSPKSISMMVSLPSVFLATAHCPPLELVLSSMAKLPGLLVSYWFFSVTVDELTSL